MLSSTEKNLIQIGVYKHKQKFDVLWFDSENRPQYLQNVTCENLIQQFHQQVQIPNVKVRFINALFPRSIWHKTTLISPDLHEQDIDLQCRLLLQQELPIPIEDLWFDYCRTPLKNANEERIRLDIFAVVKKVAQQHLEQLAPLPIKVLDNAAHALIRAFQYFHQAEPESVFLYKQEDICLAIQQHHQQFRWLQQNHQDLQLLYQEFCQRYQINNENCVVYAENTVNLPSTWQIIKTDLPFLALGCALWQRPIPNKTE